MDSHLLELCTTSFLERVYPSREMRRAPTMPPVARPVDLVERDFVLYDRFERLIFPFQGQVEGAAKRVHRSPDVQNLRDPHPDPYLECSLAGLVRGGAAIAPLLGHSR